jgi:hypothetical protein
MTDLEADVLIGTAGFGPAHGAPPIDADARA